MRVFLLPIFAFIISGCGVLERPTGYSGKPSINGYTIETCDESDFEDGWWAFETDNAIVNTLVPSYEDYCTYVSPDLVFSGILKNNTDIITILSIGNAKTRTQ